MQQQQNPAEVAPGQTSSLLVLGGACPAAGCFCRLWVSGSGVRLATQAARWGISIALAYIFWTSGVCRGICLLSWIQVLLLRSPFHAMHRAFLSKRAVHCDAAQSTAMHLLLQSLRRSSSSSRHLGLCASATDCVLLYSFSTCNIRSR
jgi:hypothetical protein